VKISLDFEGDSGGGVNILGGERSLRGREGVYQHVYNFEWLLRAVSISRHNFVRFLVVRSEGGYTRQIASLIMD
jgi:hypothetical protein